MEDDGKIADNSPVFQAGGMALGASVGYQRPMTAAEEAKMKADREREERMWRERERRERRTLFVQMAVSVVGPSSVEHVLTAARAIEAFVEEQNDG